METEMVEPDRTIMIVSIIGLVVIWGSFFYHKFVQGGSANPSGDADLPAETASDGDRAAADGAGSKGKNKKKKR